MSVTVAIVDDEIAHVDTLENCLSAFGEANGVTFVIKKFFSAIDLIEGYEPIYDVIFMDVRMPYYDGLRASKKLREIDSAVKLVFITSLAQYAVKGYEVDAFDYIVKPIDEASMRPKLKRLMLSLEKRNVKSKVFTFGREKIRVDLSDIVYFQADKHSITVFLTGERSFITRKSLASIEEELADIGEKFARCNNYTLVNPKFIRKTDGNNLYVDYVKEPFAVSRNRRNDVIESLAAYRGTL